MGKHCKRGRAATPRLAKGLPFIWLPALAAVLAAIAFPGAAGAVPMAAAAPPPVNTSPPTIRNSAEAPPTNQQSVSREVPRVNRRYLDGSPTSSGSGRT